MKVLLSPQYQGILLLIFFVRKLYCYLSHVVYNYRRYQLSHHSKLHDSGGPSYTSPLFRTTTPSVFKSIFGRESKLTHSKINLLIDDFLVREKIFYSLG